jgi:hypothetical protein
MSGRAGAAPRNYSRSRSHLRAGRAMIGMKSPGLDGGVTGVCRDRDLLLGKSGPSLLRWWGGLSHKVVNTIDGAALGAAPFFELGSAPGLPAGKLAWCWPQPHTSPGLGPSPHRIAYRDGSTVRLFAAHKRPLRVPDH